jgi:hypothetical protein
MAIPLSVASNCVMAEWQEVERSEIQVTYADTAAIRTGWAKKQMALLSDYNSPGKYDGKEFLSVLSQNEYNCKDKQSQMLSYELHAGHMGKGEVIYSNSSSSKWKAVSTGSLEETLLKMACDKK